MWPIPAVEIKDIKARIKLRLCFFMVMGGFTFCATKLLQLINSANDLKQALC
jgi:hypothetical protein